MATVGGDAMSEQPLDVRKHATASAAYAAAVTAAMEEMELIEDEIIDNGQDDFDPTADLCEDAAELAESEEV